MPALPLPFGLTQEALAAAEAEADPDSLAAATRLRRHLGPETAAAALQQASLRRRARAKLGARAARLLLTRDGLEQASRPSVAAHHAARFRSAGVRRVLDLGCGVGLDALAFLDAGLEVVAVERDPVTAALAAANLAGHADGGRAQIRCADAEQALAALDAEADPGTGVFCDPARRDARGRVWRVEDFSPSWPFVTGLLDGRRVAGVKLGPALPHALVPDTAEAEWVSEHGETVEVGLWAGPGARPDERGAVLLPGQRLAVPRPVPGHPDQPLPVGPVGAFLYEPDGAVIRAGGVGRLGEQLGARLLDAQIAYLTGDRLVATPWAVAFAVHEVLPYAVKGLRRWVREHGVGRLEIKKRGVDVDPAALRRTLAPTGPAAATLVLSRTPRGAVALVVERVVGPALTGSGNTTDTPGAAEP